MCNSYEEVLLLIQEAEITDHEKTQIEKFDQAIKQLESILIASPNDLKTHYLTGYSWYMYPKDTPLRKRKVIQYLSKTLDLDSNHIFARLYLGHFYFDEGAYKEALKQFTKVKNKVHFFYEIEQVWRVIKLQEMIICCGLRLNHKIDLPEIVELKKLYNDNSPTNIPLPTELINTLFNLLSCEVIDKKETKLVGIITMVFEVLKKLEIVDVLPKQLKLLEESLKAR